MFGPIRKAQDRKQHGDGRRMTGSSLLIVIGTLLTVTVMTSLIPVTDSAALLSHSQSHNQNYDHSQTHDNATIPHINIRISSESGTVRPDSELNDPHDPAYPEDDDYYYDDDHLSSYSDEDLENVADFGDQSRYFLKTKPKGGQEVTSQRAPRYIPEGDADGAEILMPSSSSNSNHLDVTSTTDSSTSIPGVPGLDYPVHAEVPYTGFDCGKQRYKGFFADLDTQCQAWHYCDFTDGHSTFLCPNGTLFSQVLLTCDWWFNVNCDEAQQLYVLNERLYRYIKAPQPSFPEDYHGPQVDLWLLQQLQLGLLPKKQVIVTDKMVVNNNGK